MRLYATAVYLFLYIPIGVIVLFSFNAGRHASDFRGFSVEWYGKALGNPFVTDALTTSLGAISDDSTGSPSIRPTMPWTSPSAAWRMSWRTVVSGGVT